MCACVYKCVCWLCIYIFAYIFFFVFVFGIVGNGIWISLSVHTNWKMDNKVDFDLKWSLNLLGVTQNTDFKLQTLTSSVFNLTSSSLCLQTHTRMLSSLWSEFSDRTFHSFSPGGPTTTTTSPRALLTQPRTRCGSTRRVPRPAQGGTEQSHWERRENHR